MIDIGDTSQWKREGWKVRGEMNADEEKAFFFSKTAKAMVVIFILVIGRLFLYGDNGLDRLSVPLERFQGDSSERDGGMKRFRGESSVDVSMTCLVDGSMENEGEAENSSKILLFYCDGWEASKTTAARITVPTFGGNFCVEGWFWA